DGDDGNGRRGADAREPIEADDGIGVLLGRRREAGAEADVVGAGGGARLRFVVRGDADDEARRYDRARGRKGQIVLSEVHAVGAGGEGDVDAIVDDEGDAAGAAPGR